MRPSKPAIPSMIYVLVQHRRNSLFNLTPGARVKRPFPDDCTLQNWSIRKYAVSKFLDKKSTFWVSILCQFQHASLTKTAFSWRLVSSEIDNSEIWCFKNVRTKNRHSEFVPNCCLEVLVLVIWAFPDDCTIQNSWLVSFDISDLVGAKVDILKIRLIIVLTSLPG